MSFSVLEQLRSAHEAVSVLAHPEFAPSLLEQDIENIEKAMSMVLMDKHLVGTSMCIPMHPMHPMHPLVLL